MYLMACSPNLCLKLGILPFRAGKILKVSKNTKLYHELSTKQADSSFSPHNLQLALKDFPSRLALL